MPDPRQALLDALRGVDRDTLLAVLAEVLGGGKVKHERRGGDITF